MTHHRFPLLLILAASLAATSCNKKTPPPSAKDNQDNNFYFGTEATLSPGALDNEMAEGQTDYLRSFSDDKIQWQLWNPEILNKANKAQLPIFAFVGSALGDSSRRVAKEIDANDELRRRLTSQAISTVIDTHAHPEIGQLSFHLANEIDRSLAFPMAIWMSPEGCPITWLPLGNASGEQLEKILETAAAMIDDIWSKSSHYAIVNSRRDNQARQKRFTFSADPEAVLDSRDEIFRESTRKLSAFYSPVDQDLDALGGLIPSSSLDLLLIGSRSKLLTEEVRERCQLAVTDVTTHLMENALRDPLDGGYFYARRTNDWVLPSFSKELGSQARLAEFLLKAGASLNNGQILQEGLNLTENLETRWLGANIAVLAPGMEQDTPGAFLWDYQTLREVLNEEEFQFAILAFDLAEQGNIPPSADPLGNFYRLNSLRNPNSLEELAKARQSTTAEVAEQLETVKAKLLGHRTKKAAIAPETAITVADLGMMARAQIARSIVTQNEADLETAIATARRILDDYWEPTQGLTRLRNGEQSVPARGWDYADTSLVMTLLYQRTLDDHWLVAARNILDYALNKLGSDSPLLAETLPGKRIIPIRLHNTSMIFGDSTLGLADQSAMRLFALTGEQKYRDLAQTHLTAIASRPIDLVINHTDFFISCALGDSPLIAVLQGNPASPDRKKFLALLNAPGNLPFLTIRPDQSRSGLSALPPLPDQKGEVSVVLLKDGKILGQAASEEELTGLLDSAISQSP